MLNITSAWLRSKFRFNGATARLDREHTGGGNENQLRNIERSLRLNKCEATLHA